MGEGYHDVYNGACYGKNDSEYLVIITCLYFAPNIEDFEWVILLVLQRKVKSGKK